MDDVEVFVGGTAAGPVLALDEPLSLWGGLDPATGIIIDRHHPQVGQSVAGRVLVMPSGRGSSGGSSVLAEAVRAGVGPIGVVLSMPDPILVVGGVVLGELYPEKVIPIVVAPLDLFSGLTTGQMVSIDGGRLNVS